MTYQRLRDEEAVIHEGAKPSLFHTATKRILNVAIGTVVIFGVFAVVAVSKLPSGSLYENLLPTEETPSRKNTFTGIYSKAAVATEVDICSTIGKKILLDGGNAVDAAISSALCVGSINSFASGIGGGGFMLIRTSEGNTEVVDFRETAPAKSKETPYIENPDASKIGPLSVAIPGEIRGFEKAHKKYGQLEWARLFEPVIKLNREGFPVNSILRKRLLNSQWILQSPTWSDIYAPKGVLVEEGEIIYRHRFADTLELIAEKGADVFYKGTIAESLVNTLQDMGGIVTLDDFENYQAKFRQPIVTEYNGRTITTVPPPASGAVLALMLNVLEGYNLKSRNETNLHRIVEAMRFGYAKRSELGDPDFVDIKIPLAESCSKRFASAIRDKISDKHTLPQSKYGAKFENPSSHGTAHLSVIDENDMAVSLTTTINLVFGSQIMDPSTGIILNDQIDDFSIRGHANSNNLPPSPMNYIQPGKRPLSSTAPTIIEYDSKVEMVIGASGGSRITTAVLNSIINHYEFSMPLDKAIFNPRMHDQLYPNECIVEYGFDANYRKKLEEKGHTIRILEKGEYQSNVQAVQRIEHGRVFAVSDKRKRGKPDGFNMIPDNSFFNID